MTKEELIKQYVDQITSRTDIEVEITEDTVVLYREPLWHIYLIPERYTAIGCFLDDDIRIMNLLKEEMGSILYIYNNTEDETV